MTMKFIFNFTLIFSLTLFTLNLNAQREAMGATSKIITPEDLNIIIGDWAGNITYLDYRTNKPFTMPANLAVKPGKSSDILLLYNTYPDEPKANNTDKVKISKNGTYLNKAMVTSREVLPNGLIIIQTENTGKDDNRQAVIKYTYTLGQNQFIIRKEVQFEDSKDWIKRSEFNYVR